MPAGATWTTPVVLAPAADNPHVAGAASSATRSVIVWGDGTNLYAASRPTDATSFSQPTLIGTGGSFGVFYVDSVLSVTGAPDGSVVAAWIRFSGESGSAVMVSTLPAGSSTWTTTQLADGTNLGYVQAAAGSDGTLAVTWTADEDSPGLINTVVQAAVLPSGASSWTSPVTVSDDAATGPDYPLNQTPCVAVTDDEAVTVAWAAEDGVTTASNQAIYRERATTWTPQAGSWSAPVWLSPADGQGTSAPALAASGQTVAAIWDGPDGEEATTLSGGTWQTPVSLGAGALVPALAAGPAQGEFTAVWADYVYPAPGPYEMETSTWDSGVWSAETAIGPTGDYTSPILATSNNGDVTAAWESYEGATSAWSMQVTDNSGSGWSSPVTAGAAAADQLLALSEDPSGYLTAVFIAPDGNDSDGNLEAIATTPPPLSNVEPGSISGTPDVGQALTASPGTWSPAAETALYQWNRSGQPVPGATAARYRLTAADLGTRITVTITAERDGSGDGTATYGPDHISRGSFRLMSGPFISGRFRPGSRLTGHSGRWTPTPATVQYQWLLNGQAIPGATSSHLRVRSLYQGQRIRLRVTVVLAGYHDAVAKSATYTVR